MLRAAKEEAEKPEKEAKDQHQKLWEGMSRARVSRPGRPAPRPFVCFSCWLSWSRSLGSPRA